MLYVDAGQRQVPLPAMAASWPAGLAVWRLSIADVDGLWALFQQDGYRRFGEIERFEGRDEIERWIDLNRGHFQIVGSVDRVIVGFAGLYPLRGRQGHVGWTSIAVRDEFQGRGIGRALLQIVLATADRFADLRRVQLNVFVDNVRAISFYERNGFRAEGRHARFALRDGAYIDALTMARLV